MNVVATALKRDPTIADSLRLFTIATNLMYEDKNGGDGEKPNWNGASRDEVFETYPELWWVESDWTYNAMFDGPEFEAGEPVGGPPVELLRQLASVGGALGAHIKDVVAHERVRWARYFRAGGYSERALRDRRRSRSGRPNRGQLGRSLPQAISR
ncbi:MAG: hypothetical protein VCF24_02010 [Candidatus Latescibacterota bacterium]